MATQRRQGRLANVLASSPFDSETAVVRKYVAVVETFCEMIEHHRRINRARLLTDCLALLGDLCAGVLRLPKGKRDDGIFDRRHKIFQALHPDPGLVILTMMKRTRRKGPGPNLWDPIARKWMRVARCDPTRIAPVRADPYFDTLIPVDVCHDLYASLCEYLAEINRYWIVYCPYHRDEAIRTALASDFAEIWNDIKGALCVYRRGSPRERQHAIWMWRWSFHYHWGRHAVNAMNALAWLVSEASSDARDP